MARGKRMQIREQGGYGVRFSIHVACLVLVADLLCCRAELMVATCITTFVWVGATRDRIRRRIRRDPLADCRGSRRLCPMARHALGVAPPRAARARLGMRLGALHRREEARLVAAAHEYRTKAVRARRGLVRAQLLDDRVAPGGGVGVEVLIGERVGVKASADAQVGARDLAVGRAVLARDVPDQARAPAHGVHVPRAHGATRTKVVDGAAKVVDARVLGPGHHASSGTSRGSSSRGRHGVWLGRTPRAAICRRFGESDAKQFCRLTSCLKRYKGRT
jgi:hypothetical protein